MYIEEHSHSFMHYFGVKTLSETPCSPPLMQPGYGARYEFRVQVECTSVIATSTFSAASAPVRTLPVPAEAPVGVLATPITGTVVTENARADSYFLRIFLLFAHFALSLIHI